jgi:hypothetical protein
MATTYRKICIRFKNCKDPESTYFAGDVYGEFDYTDLFGASDYETVENAIQVLTDLKAKKSRVEIVEMTYTVNEKSKVLHSFEPKQKGSQTIKKHKVKEVEHDSWSGGETDYYYFDTEKEAKKFVDETNGKNTLKHVPSCYWTAEYIGVVEGVMINKKFRELK